MHGSVDAAERGAWERDGFFIRERVFSPQEVVRGVNVAIIGSSMSAMNERSKV